MGNNPLLSNSPSLQTSQIADTYIKKNFENLQSYFTANNQLLGFKFVEVNLTKATANFTVGHGLGYIPKDILITQVIGNGQVTFNYGLFDLKNVNITTTDACRVRFFVGTYYNQQSLVQAAMTDAWLINPDPVLGVAPTPAIQANTTPAQSSTTTSANASASSVSSFTAYSYNGYFPGSGSNYWVLSNPGYTEFATTGTIPPITTLQNINMGAVTGAPVGVPGFKIISAPVTGVLYIKARVLLIPGQLSTQTTIGLRLIEAGGTILDLVGQSVTNAAVANAQYQFSLEGYFPVTLGTSYTFRIQGKIDSGGSLFIGAGPEDTCLNFTAHYINV